MLDEAAVHRWQSQARQLAALIRSSYDPRGLQRWWSSMNSDEQLAALITAMEEVPGFENASLVEVACPELTPASLHLLVSALDVGEFVKSASEADFFAIDGALANARRRQPPLSLFSEAEAIANAQSQLECSPDSAKKFVSQLSVFRTCCWRSIAHTLVLLSAGEESGGN